MGIGIYSMCMVMLGFFVEFESEGDPREFYDDLQGHREEIDDKFEEMVVEKLDEECEVEYCYSETGHPTCAVFRADFERTTTQLYDDFGRTGMSDVVGEVAEEVYGSPVDHVKMEQW